MTYKLTPQLEADLNAHHGRPMPMESQSGDVVGYMVDKIAFLRMHGLADDSTLEDDQYLKALIQVGLASDDAPAEEVYRELHQ